jgi:hypothetical protein
MDVGSGTLQFYKVRTHLLVLLFKMAIPFAPILAAGKFIVTRPIVLPLFMFSGGLVYGAYDLSKLTGRALFRRDAAGEGWTTRAAGWVGGTGTLSTMMFLSPYKQNQKLLWQDMSFHSLKAAGMGILKFNMAALFMSGIVGGLSAAYALPNRK